MTTAEERLARFQARVCAVTHLRRVHLAESAHAEVEASIQSHKSGLALLALALLAGSITRAAFVEKATALLKAGMTQAAIVGGAAETEAGTIADDILAQQQQRIDQFADDLHDSDLLMGDEPGSGLSPAMSRVIAGGLAGLLFAGYQAGKVSGAPADAQYGYRCRDDKASCDDCTARAANGPYSKADLPGYPGDGSTMCGGNDRCEIVKV